MRPLLSLALLCSLGCLAFFQCTPVSTTVYQSNVDFSGGIPSTLVKHCSPNCTTSTIVVQTVFDSTSWAVFTVPTTGSAAFLAFDFNASQTPGTPSNPATSSATGLCWSYDWVMHSDPALITGGAPGAQFKKDFDRDWLGSINNEWTIVSFSTSLSGKLIISEDNGVDSSQCTGGSCTFNTGLSIAQDTKYSMTYLVKRDSTQNSGVGGGRQEVWINPTGPSPSPTFDSVRDWGAWPKHMGNNAIDGSVKQRILFGAPYVQSATGTVVTYAKNFYASSDVDLTTGKCK